MAIGTAAAVIGGGISLIGANKQAKAAKNAANIAAQSQDAATAEQRRQFDISEEQYKPYREAGLRGLNQYEQDMGGYQAAEGLIPSNIRDPFKFGAAEFEQYKDPGYDFRLSEGERALNRGAAATGKFQSGSRYRGLMDLGQQMASQEFGAARQRAFQDYGTDVSREAEQYNRGLESYGRQYIDPMNRQAGLAGIGQTATNQLGGLRQNMSQQVAQGITASGEAQAAGQLGSARAWGQGLSSLGSSLGSLGQAPQISGTITPATPGYGQTYQQGTGPLQGYGSGIQQNNWWRK